MASAATWTLPSVPFLKPTGQLRPEASWRWLWLSVVRAPIAPQATSSAMNCGLSRSRNSVPVGTPSIGQLEQELPGALEAFVDGEAAVEVRVVDVALPADGRARLLEVGAHDDEEIVLQLGRHRLQAQRVLDRLVVIVDRARADDDDEPVVAAMQDRGDRGAAAFDEGERIGPDRHPLLQQRRRDERTDGADAHVVDPGRVERAVARADLAVVLGIVEWLHQGVTAAMAMAIVDVAAMAQDGAPSPRSSHGPIQRRFDR
jgi:hypothetical protein